MQGSQIAQNYCNRNCADYPTIAWVMEADLRKLIFKYFCEILVLSRVEVCDPFTVSDSNLPY